MPYKVETIYWNGWADAGWTVQSEKTEIPLRFESYEVAKAALAEYLNEVKTAVLAGNMDEERDESEFRIVAERQ